MPASSRKQQTVRSDRINPSMPASVVISRFGGLTRFCQLTGYKTSTVWDWMAKGFIPADRQTHVLEMARLYELPLEPADFVYQPPGGEVASG